MYLELLLTVDLYHSIISVERKITIITIRGMKNLSELRKNCFL